MGETAKVKQGMRISESAMRPEKRWVACDSLVQQLGRLQIFHFCRTAETRQKKVFGLSVKAQSYDVARRGAFDVALFLCRKLGMKLVGNRHRDLTLNDENVGKIAFISLSP